MRLGLDYDLFWRLTPREVFRLAVAASDKARDEFEERRLVAYEAARLTAYAFHEPNKMPEYERAGPKKKVPPEAEIERSRAFFMALAKRSA